MVARGGMSCMLANGRVGRANKSRYYRFGGGTQNLPAGIVEAGSTCVKRRRMNPANPRALRRAIRRQEAFVSLARRALKGSGYKVVSRGYGQRKPKVIVESGRGSVVSA